MIIQFVKYFILIIIFQGFVFSSSYSIFGIVLDENTKEPIRDINIYIKDQNITTISDDDGYFKFFLVNPEKNNFNLVFNLLGYENKIMKINLYQNSKITKCEICDNFELDLGRIFLNIESIELGLIQIQSNSINQNKFLI